MVEFFSDPFNLVCLGFIGAWFSYHYADRDASAEYEKKRNEYNRKNQISFENIDPRPFPKRERSIIREILDFGGAFSALYFFVGVLQTCSDYIN